MKGLGSLSTQEVTARLLISEPSNFKQALERACLYESRIKKFIDQGDLQMSIKTCHNAPGNVEWFYYSSLRRVFGYAAIEESFYLFFRKFTDLKSIHACCCLEHGDPKSASQMMTCFLGEGIDISLTKHTPLQALKAQRYLALALVAEGAGNAAANSFLQARGLSWISNCIDQELIAMKMRFNREGADPATLMAKNSLKHALDPMRHSSALNGELKESIPSEERAKAYARFELSET